MKRSCERTMVCACLFLLALSGTASAAMSPPDSHARRESLSTLRVGFWTLWRDRQVVLLPKGKATFRTCVSCAAAPLRESTTVRVDRDGSLAISRGNTTLRKSELILNGSVRLTAHGESELLRFPVAIAARSGVLVFTVTLPTESYVEKVVASESGPNDSRESLKALAVTVRTFALHERHGHPDYDLCDSTHCQLLHWAGVPQRQSAAHRAALETAGETLWFHDRQARAYFTGDCGGQTASARDVWLQAASQEYLTSRADTYCSRTPSKEWISDITRANLANALAKRRLVAPGWQHLQIDKRSASGRVIAVRVDHVVIPAEEFRIAVGESLGWNLIQSTWFEMSENGDHYSFRGRGSGHGVGLCQKGSAVMASQGRSAAEILAQYFPGAYPADEVTGKRWLTLGGDGFALQSTTSSDASFLPLLAQARAEATQRSGLNQSQPIVVRAFASIPAFRDATLSPGWVAAFTEGDWIATQPLSILAARHLLADTMRHEFLHALVEGQARADTPLWLREGLVEVWSADFADPSPRRVRRPVLQIAELEAALRHPRNEAQSQAAHLDAAAYARQLLDRDGRDHVLSWLRSGIPGDVVLRLGQR